MTEVEAVELATGYVAMHVPYAKPTVAYSVYLRASVRPEPNAQSDAWLVHFPRILKEGVIIEEPDTVGVLVDTTTRSVRVVTLL